MQPRRALVVGALLVGGWASRSSAQPSRFAELHRAIPDDPSTGFPQPRAVAVGDIDGDGDLDALLSRQGGASRLLRNEGSGVLRDASGQLPPDAGSTRGIALGDVDGDGDLDALLAKDPSPAPGPPHRLLLNGGAGTFTDGTSQLPAVIGSGRAAALCDVDGDGDLDAVLSDFFALRLYLNNGAALFTDASGQVPAAASYDSRIAPGDVDGDGDVDLFVELSSGMGLLLNNGAGVFSDATSQVPPAACSPAPPCETVADFVLADLDGDGDLDAFVAEGEGYDESWAGGWLPDRLLVNSGNGVFADASAQIPPDFVGATGVAGGDCDGDGDLDLLVGIESICNPIGCSASPVSALTNLGAGVFAFGSVQLAGDSTEVEEIGLGDLDGDGDLDALLLKESPRSDRLFLNDGGGTLLDVTRDFPIVEQASGPAAWGDVDADGDPDLLVAYPSNFVLAPSTNRLFLNDGAGHVTPGPPFPALQGLTTAIAFADVEGDGDRDAFLGACCVPDRLLLNAGAGSFTVAPSQMPSVSGGTTDLEVGDADGDGDPDLVLAGTPERLYRNDGVGTFTYVPGDLPATPGASSSVAGGDVDGDGDLDLLVGKSGFSGPAQSRLYLNDGTGSFSDGTTQLPAFLADTNSVLLGDVDGDGDLDALLGTGGPSLAPRTRLYLNDGLGLFTVATGQLPPEIAYVTRVAALGLADEDGDPDLFLLVGSVSPFADGAATVYVNNGLGSFATAPSAMPAGGDLARALVVEDVDGDDDLDVLEQHSFGRADRLLRNVTRQLAWRGPPRLGKPLTLDLYGPPAGFALLAFSFGTGTIPVPGLGTLRLDLPSTFVLGVLGLDANGRASVTFPVPGNPAYVGVSLYWQALVGPPAHFTNLEVTTFSNL